MEDNIKKINFDTINHLQSWIKQHKENEEISKLVYEALEIKKWEEKVLNTNPDDTSFSQEEILLSHYTDDFLFWQSQLPSLPNIKFSSLNSSSILSSSSSSATYNFVHRISDNSNNSEIKSWAVGISKEYEDIQEKNKLKDKVKLLIKSLNVSLIEDFEIIENNISRDISNIEKNVIAGIAMRNLLEHIKGRLFQKIKSNNKNWEKICSELSNYPIDSLEYKKLLLQDEVHKRLHNKLSDVSKNNNKSGLVFNNIYQLYIELLDHIFITLSLLDLNK